MHAKLAQVNASAPIVNCLPQRRTISYWRLGEQVTGGRWFEIYRAAPRSMAEQTAYDYAIKLVNPHLTATQATGALDRLGREAAACDSIQHHGIIPLLDAELDQPVFFVVQPWVGGGTLDQFMAAAPNISLIRCLWIFRQIAEAIGAAHEKGRVYFGLDPEHVLLGSGGRVMLIGWSHSHMESQPLNLPIEEFRFARYAAPECLDGSGLANPRSDIYSIGALIYQVLGNQLPYRYRSIEQLVEQQQVKRPVDLIRVQPSCPASLSRFVSQMLAANPLERPSIQEVLEQLIAVEIENLENPSLIQL